MSNQKIEHRLKENENELKFGHALRGQTAEEEFAYILRLIRRTPFYREHGYKVVLPQVEPFTSLDDQSLPNVDERELFDIFVAKEYDSGYFDSTITTLQPKLRSVEQKISKPFDDWNREWGYIVFPTYQVRLTKYGTGGFSNDDEGSITMRVSEDGSFPFSFPIENNTIHEEIHLGVEKTIVDPFKLTHLEKEILVNRMCMVQFGGSIFDYSGRTDDYTNLSIYHAVNSESLLKLPDAIAEWAETRN